MHAIVEERHSNSATSLIIANLIAVIFAVFEGWDLRELMLLYWCQSVIIGYFSFKRMLDLKEFSTKGVRMNGRSVEPTEKTKRSMAWFFVIHYGMFHFAYLVFLFADAAGGFQGSWFFLGVCVLVFYFNHRYSYSEHGERDAERKPNIGTIMFFPYARIIPMHLTIIAGGALNSASTATLLMFLGLKTLADVVMHKIEHSAWRALPGSQ